jgi:putative ABC transport system ATP-binding protein
MSAETLIELRNVSVPSRSDSETVSLESVSWTVHAGEFWIVGGLQGSGKSDLMFLLAGLTKPVAGSFTLFGQDMTQHFGDEFLPCRLRMGMVFDDARLFNHLTVGENVALPARYHNDLHADEIESWIKPLLKATDIAEFASNTPGVLSRSWRRRTALARALALRPEVLLLENPLRGLDGRHAAWWIEFVTRLWTGHDLMSGRPMTVILSTDEFRPWRGTGAQFVTLGSRKFAVSGNNAPEDDERWSRLLAGKDD